MWSLEATLLIVVVASALWLSRVDGLQQKETAKSNRGHSLEETATSRRRRNTGNAATAATGKKFYSTTVNYTSLNLPDLTGANHSVIAEDLPYPSLSSRVFDLPFSFQFFGHVHRKVRVSAQGFIYPHTAVYDAPDHRMFSKSLFEVSHIAPLVSFWVLDKDLNTSIEMYSTKDNVHFVWTVTQDLLLNQTVTYTIFSSTLYSTGHIAFNYEQLADRSEYESSSRWSQLYHSGEIGLADSSVDDFNASLPDLSVFRYANINVSSAFNNTARPRSIVFSPTGFIPCSTAVTKAECSARPSDLGCFWCPIYLGYTKVPNPFCTDGRSDKNFVHTQNLQCTTIEDATASNTYVHHKYYSVNTSSSLPALDTTHAQLIFSSTTHSNHREALYAEKMILPFDFPYYGHLVRVMYISSHGEIFPHPRLCGWHLCNRLRVILATSSISPLSGNWGVYASPHDAKRGQILRLDGPNGSYVRIVWQHMRHLQYTASYCAPYDCSWCYCPSDTQTATFHVTLYPNGEIHFGYPHLLARSSYNFNPGRHHEGFIGLLDSFWAQPVQIVPPAITLFSSKYEPIDKTSEYSATQKVRSIRFYPQPASTTCNTARSVRSCQQKPAALNCFWCVSGIAVNPHNDSFCTDYTLAGRNTYYFPGLTCYHARTYGTTTRPQTTRQPVAQASSPINRRPTAVTMDRTTLRTTSSPHNSMFRATSSRHNSMFQATSSAHDPTLFTTRTGNATPSAAPSSTSAAAIAIPVVLAVIAVIGVVVILQKRHPKVGKWLRVRYPNVGSSFVHFTNESD